MMARGGARGPGPQAPVCWAAWLFTLQALVCTPAWAGTCDACPDQDLFEEFVFVQLAGSIPFAGSPEHRRGIATLVADRWANSRSIRLLDQSLHAQIILHGEFTGDPAALRAIAARFRGNASRYLRARALQALAWAIWLESDQAAVRIERLAEYFGGETDKLLSLSLVALQRSPFALAPAQFIIHEWQPELAAGDPYPNRKTENRIRRTIAALRPRSESGQLYTMHLRLLLARMVVAAWRDGATEAAGGPHPPSVLREQLAAMQAARQPYARMFRAVVRGQLLSVSMAPHSVERLAVGNIDSALPWLRQELAVAGRAWHSPSRAARIAARIVERDYCIAVLPAWLAHQAWNFADGAVPRAGDHHWQRSRAACRRLAGDELAADLHLVFLAGEYSEQAGALLRRGDGTPAGSREVAGQP